MTSSPYSYKVIKHFQNPKNVGRMDNPDGKASEGSPLCGDMVSVYLKVNSESLIIEDIKFESYGCASNIATGSIITELAKGRTLEEAKKIDWKMAADELGGLPPVKIHCSVLAVAALRSAIQNYEEKNGLAKLEDIELSEDNVKKKLSHVINPNIGKDIIFSKTVKHFKIVDGVVEVGIELEKSNQFANNIKEEVEEALSNLEGLKKVEVVFSD